MQPRTGLQRREGEAPFLPLLEAGLADAMIPFYLEFVKLTRLAVLFLVVFAVSYALGYVDKALRLLLRTRRLRL